MSEFERKFETFNCGCALRRGCTLRGTLEGYVKESMLDDEIDRWAEKLDVLETQLAEKTREVERKDNYVRIHDDNEERLRAELAEKTAALQQREEENTSLRWHLDDKTRHLEAAEEQLKAKDELLRRAMLLICKATCARDRVLLHHHADCRAFREALKGDTKI